MKKYFILRIICAMLALVLIVASFAACNETKGPEETTTGSGETSTGSTDLDYFSIDVSQYITVDPSAYQNINVTVSDIYEINDKNVKNYIDGLLKEYPQDLKITDRPIQKDDTVYIYYEGLLNGVAFQGGTHAETSTSEPYALKIGSGKFIDGFEDGLIGVIPSETSKDNPVALNLTFPANYGNADLAGKDVVFNVYVKYISNETYVPEYNAETITEILEFKATGSDVIGEFEDHVRTLLQDEQDTAVLKEISEILVNGSTVISYPQESLDYWYDYYVDEIQWYVDYYTMYGMSVTFEQMARQLLGLESTGDWKTALEDLAKNSVRSRLVYFAVAQQNNITVTDEEYEAMIQYFIDYYKQSGYTYTREDIINGIGEDSIRENALMQETEDLLFSNCTVSYKPSESK